MEWSKEEIEKLKDLWDLGHTASDIASRMGCTRNAIIGKVHRLGMNDQTRMFASVNKRSWTDDEDEILREMHRLGKKQWEIAVAVDRTKGAVCARVSKLGLSRPYRGIFQ